jgi:SPP1 gp7 family putative phage head morphogenesis protein
LFEDRAVSVENRQQLWDYYYTMISDGIDVGYNPKPEMYDPALSHSLKYNIAEFSAFKETSFRKQLEAALTSNGKVTPWSDFKKKADELNIAYNRRWLKTEYDHTVAAANMAQKWQDFEADKDLYPNLKYQAVGDASTREQHKAWDGLILPINHPFWKTHLPPNDWGCRCDALQSDEDISKTIPNVATKQAFENNAALSGKIFSEIPYANGLSAAEVKEANKQAKRNFELKEYKTIEIPFKAKGKILSSNLVDVKASDYNDVLACCKHFAKLGKTTEILPRLDATLNNPLYDVIFGKLKNTPYYGKCPDLKVNDLLYEFEGFESLSKNTLSKMITRGLKQSSRIILKDDGSTKNHILKLIKFRKKEGQFIDEVYILRKNGNLDKIY